MLFNKMFEIVNKPNSTSTYMRAIPSDACVHVSFERRGKAQLLHSFATYVLYIITMKVLKIVYVDIIFIWNSKINLNVTIETLVCI